MTQAEKTLARIERGDYVPDASVRGMTFQDGSSLLGRKRIDDVMIWSAIDREGVRVANGSSKLSVTA